MGLSDPFKAALQLNECLWAIHIQCNPESCKLAFAYDLLVLVQSLHQFSVHKVLWATLTMVHFGLLQADKFMVDQEDFDPTQHLCVWDMTPNFTTESEL